MREIKFRGLELMTGDWVYGSHLKTGVGSEYIVPQNLITNQLPQYTVDKDTVGQFTGLQDKNGKEIYEGDIVKQEYSIVLNTDFDPISLGIIDQETDEGYHTGEVVILASKGTVIKNPVRHSVSEEEPCMTNQYKSLASYRCEIIGNIYENPELLEVIG